MDDWMNVISKRELTEDEILKLRYRSRKVKNAEEELRQNAKIIQNPSNSQAPNQSTEVPSMIDLPPSGNTDNEKENLTDRFRGVARRIKDAVSPLPPIKNNPNQKPIRSSNIFKPKGQTPTQTTTSAPPNPQQPPPAPPNPQQPPPSPPPNENPPSEITSTKINNDASTKINNAIAQLKSKIQAEQNKKIRGMEVFDKKKNLDALNAKLKQLEAFKAKNKL